MAAVRTDYPPIVETAPPIRTLKDIEALERVPLEERVWSWDLNDWLRRGWSLDPDKVAINYVENGDVTATPVQITFSELERRSIQAANLFHSLGVQILRRSLEAPTRQIAENSAADGGVVVERMLTGTGSVGFDAAKKEYVDLVAAGIVDPAKVVRMALENAVSVASVLLLTEATMTEKPNKHEDRLPPEPGL